MAIGIADWRPRSSVLRWIEIAARGAHTAAFADRHLRHADTILDATVVVSGTRNTGLLRRCNARFIERAAFQGICDLQWPVAAAQFILTPGIGFHVTEEGQYIVKAPAAVS